MSFFLPFSNSNLQCFFCNTLSEAFIKSFSCFIYHLTGEDGFFIGITLASEKTLSLHCNSKVVLIKLQLISLSGASEDSILEGRSSFKTVMVPDILMLLETLEREQIEIDVEEVAGRKFNLFYGN